MDSLFKLMNIKSVPLNQGKIFIELTCGVEFEPFGRSSEDWDIVWKLKLPQIPHYWKSINGWRPGTMDKSMEFYGRTKSEVVEKAINFIKETRSQNLDV